MQSHLGCKDLDTVMKIVSLAFITLASLYTIIKIVNTEKVEGRFMFYIIVLLSSVLSVNYYIFGNGLYVGSCKC